MTNQVFYAKGIFMIPFFILSLVAMTSCTTSTSRITEQEVKDLFNSYFFELSVDSEGRDGVYDLITSDYYLFENEKKYSMPEFLEFVDSFDIVDDNWMFSDFDISIDENSAHVTLKNSGRFIVNVESGRQQLDYDWLESAYIVREDGELKFKFYFSDTVSLTVTDL